MTLFLLQHLRRRITSRPIKSTPANQHFQNTWRRCQVHTSSSSHVKGVNINQHSVYSARTRLRSQPKSCSREGKARITPVFIIGSLCNANLHHLQYSPCLRCTAHMTYLRLLLPRASHVKPMTGCGREKKLRSSRHSVTQGKCVVYQTPDKLASDSQKS